MCMVRILPVEYGGACGQRGARGRIGETECPMFGTVPADVLRPHRRRKNGVLSLAGFASCPPFFLRVRAQFGAPLRSSLDPYPFTWAPILKSRRGGWTLVPDRAHCRIQGWRFLDPHGAWHSHPLPRRSSPPRPRLDHCEGGPIVQINADQRDAVSPSRKN